MIADPDMIRKFAEEQNFEMPEEGNETWKPTEYPHWYVLMATTIGVPLDWHSFQDRIRHNAQLLAGIPKQQLIQMSINDLKAQGLMEMR